MTAPRTSPSSGLKRAQHGVETARYACHHAYDALLVARERLDDVVEQAFREQSFVPLAGLFARVEAAEVRFRSAKAGVRAAEDGVRKMTEAMSARIG